MVEAYFAWVKEKKKDGRIAEKSKTGKGLSYSLNQEEYLKVFLENGNVTKSSREMQKDKEKIRPPFGGLKFCQGTHYLPFTIYEHTSNNLLNLFSLILTQFITQFK